MKYILFILLITLSLVAEGQRDLCESCALTIADLTDSNSCCGDCLREYYINQLQQNISHGLLSKYYKSDIRSTFIPLPDTLSANFFVAKKENRIGFYLKDSDLMECTYCLVHLECEDSTVIQPGSSIVLIVNDTNLFKEGEHYYLSLHPYFKKNQNYRIVNGEIRTIIGGSHTLFDLVYKEWLIVKLPVGHNYFFML